MSIFNDLRGRADGKWWHEGVTLVRGCTRVNYGCDHCWAKGMAKRFPVLRPTRGEVEYGSEELSRLGLGKRRVISIWNDLFHEGVTDKQIGRALAAMDGSNNLYIVLTKRPYRAHLFAHSFHSSIPENLLVGATLLENDTEYSRDVVRMMFSWPKFFVCCEPLVKGHGVYLESTFGRFSREELRERLRWIVVGRERGPGARAMDVESHRRIVVFSKTHGIPLWEKVTESGNERRDDPRIEYPGLLS